MPQWCWILPQRCEGRKKQNNTTTRTKQQTKTASKWLAFSQDSVQRSESWRSLRSMRQGTEFSDLFSAILSNSWPYSTKVMNKLVLLKCSWKKLLCVFLPGLFLTQNADAVWPLWDCAHRLQAWARGCIPDELLPPSGWVKNTLLQISTNRILPGCSDFSSNCGTEEIERATFLLLQILMNVTFLKLK